QFGREARRWVVKDGSHYYHRGAIADVYPDAMLVWIHRDPVKSLASALAMIRPTTGARSNHTDGSALRQVHKVRRQLEKALADPRSRDGAVCHVLYADLVDDPVATIHR